VGRREAAPTGIARRCHMLASTASACGRGPWDARRRHDSLREPGQRGPRRWAV